MARSPVRLGEVLRTALARLPGAAALADWSIWSEWDELVGDPLCRHARPVRLRRGVLIVRVDDSAWMQELHFLKRDIRERVNARLGRTAVRDLFLVLGDA